MRIEESIRSRAARLGPAAWAAVACAALAALSLLAPFAPGFDAWAWLVWGREITELDLDTTAGPSWKPLPPLIAAVLSPAGGAVPELWLWLTRTAWLAAALLAGVVAVRLTPQRALAALPGGPIAVAAVAALSVVLLDDTFTPWLRQGATGLSEPLLVALALGAFSACLARRDRLALGLLFGCALLRPEAWVLLAWVGWKRWRQGLDRPALAALAVGVPLLWFAPDLFGSGDPLTGASRAREGTGAPPLEALEVAWRLALMPLALLWAGAAVAVLDARRRGDRAPLELAAAAAAWAGQVALLAAAGYAGLPRFMAPAAAAVCVLGASGAAVTLERVRDRAAPRRVAVAAAGVVAVLAAGQLAWRSADLVGDVRGVSERSAREQAVLGLAAQTALDARARCGPVYLGDYLHGPALAWQSERPLKQVRPLPRETPIERGTAIVEVARSATDPVLRGGRSLKQSGGWLGLGFSCASLGAVQFRPPPADFVRVP